MFKWTFVLQTLCKSACRTFFKQIFACIESENLANAIDHEVLNKVFPFP